MFQSDVEFRKVGFSYPTRPDARVMEGFNLKVGLGQTVALVGPSGCGKTTAVQLLLRMYDVGEGEVSMFWFFPTVKVLVFICILIPQILVGGRDIRTLNLRWLRSNIGLVSQKPVLFDTTIAENIRYGKEDATTEEIVEAAKTANAHGFIVSLPDGYNTMVGDCNTQLSAGEVSNVGTTINWWKCLIPTRYLETITLCDYSNVGATAYRCFGLVGPHQCCSIFLPLCRPEAAYCYRPCSGERPQDPSPGRGHLCLGLSE